PLRAGPRALSRAHPRARRAGMRAGDGRNARGARGKRRQRSNRRRREAARAIRGRARGAAARLSGAHGRDAPGPGGAAPRARRSAASATGASKGLALEPPGALAHRRQLAVSPLYIVASVGLGKTPLASAVVAEVGERGERAIYASGEQFTNELLASIRAQRTAEFNRRYRECDVLGLEDVHFLRGKQSTQPSL